MNFANQASGLASLGRGEDSMLVHMTPGEVGSLQQIAKNNGGSLTTNPETGLPEASFLSNILPAIAGIGLSFVPGIGPLAAGLLVGGGTALTTKDIGRGLTAGLGAFGGAGLGSGLQGLAPLSKIPAAGMKSAIASNAASVGQGAKLAATSGLSNFAPAGTGAGLIGTGGVGATKAGLAALTPFFASSMKPTPFRPVQTAEFNPYYGGPYQFQEGPVRFPTKEQLLDDDTSEFSYFDYKYPQTYQRSFAEGGSTGEDYAGNGSEGFLEGPGDGMSDNICAEITHEDGDKQKALLSAGEFIVSADVVSGLGNGDSNAGAKKLYDMMDRVRKARTGTERQGREIDADNFLPA